MLGSVVGRIYSPSGRFVIENEHWDTVFIDLYFGHRTSIKSTERPTFIRLGDDFRVVMIVGDRLVWALLEAPLRAGGYSIERLIRVAGLLTATALDNTGELILARNGELHYSLHDFCISGHKKADFTLPIELLMAKITDDHQKLVCLTAGRFISIINANDGTVLKSFEDTFIHPGNFCAIVDTDGHITVLPHSSKGLRKNINITRVDSNSQKQPAIEVKSPAHLQKLGDFYVTADLSGCFVRQNESTLGYDRVKKDIIPNPDYNPSKYSPVPVRRPVSLLLLAHHSTLHSGERFCFQLPLYPPFVAIMTHNDPPLSIPEYL